MKAAHSKAVVEALCISIMFESYVKAAHSKAFRKALNEILLFESYVKAAHSKADYINKCFNACLRAM